MYYHNSFWSSLMLLAIFHGTRSSSSHSRLLSDHHPFSVHSYSHQRFRICLHPLPSPVFVHGHSHQQTTLYMITPSSYFRRVAGRWGFTSHPPCSVSNLNDGVFSPFHFLFQNEAKLRLVKAYTALKSLFLLFYQTSNDRIWVKFSDRWNPKVCI